MTDFTGRGEAQNGARIDRRSIVKGGAWAVPVVALAVATPAQAASVDCVRVGRYTSYYTYVQAQGVSSGGRWLATSRARVYVGESTNAAVSYYSDDPQDRTVTTTSFEYWVKLAYEVDFDSDTINGWTIQRDSGADTSSELQPGVYLYAYRVTRSGGGTLTSRVVTRDEVPAQVAEPPQIQQPRFVGNLITNDWVTSSSRDWRNGGSLRVPFAFQAQVKARAEGNGCKPQVVEGTSSAHAEFPLGSGLMS